VLNEHQELDEEALRFTVSRVKSLNLIRPRFPHHKTATMICLLLDEIMHFVKHSDNVNRYYSVLRVVNSERTI
jgi:hypothetical protein